MCCTLEGGREDPVSLPGPLNLDLNGNRRDLGNSLEPRGQCWGWYPDYRSEKVIQVKLQLREGGSRLSIWVSTTGFGSRDKQNLCVENVSGLNYEQPGGRRQEDWEIHNIRAFSRRQYARGDMSGACSWNTSSAFAIGLFLAKKTQTKQNNNSKTPSFQKWLQGAQSPPLS